MKVITQSVISAFCLLIAGAFTPVQAQRMVLTDAKDSPVTVESAVVSTEVTGRFAVTTFDMVFRNPNARVLEGNFEFPLLDGQSVVRFALDMGGQLRDAVPVEKEKGRVVFEDIERRRVDPGLLEQTAGNNYRVRVFPIPANGVRRILIAYQEDLTRRPGTASYKLPLAFPETLKNFKLTLNLLGGETQAAKVRDNLGLDLPAWRESRVIQVEKTDFKAVGLLEIELPALQRAAVMTGRFEEREYFYAEVPLPAGASSQARAMPKTVGLLWDSSGSGAARDHAREFAMLDAWFRRLGDVQVRLVRLQDKAFAAGVFAVSKGEWSKLRRALEKTEYDGASSLDGLADDAAVEEWLLFSDGLFNYGVTANLSRLPLKGAVHAVLACQSSNPGWLRGIAQRNSGEFVDLLAVSPELAATRLRTESLRILDLVSDPSELAQVYPEAGAVLADNSFVVAGILRQPSASLRVTVGHSAKDAREIVLNLKSGENTTQLAPRGWALAKIAQLSIDQTGNREDIRRTSCDFGIVSADTSLIVLENLQDYVTYKITPPAELRAQWQALRQRFVVSQQKDRMTHLDDIARRFADKVAWYEKTFPKGERPKFEEPMRKAMQFNERSVSDSNEPVALSAFSVQSEAASAPRRARSERRSVWSAQAAPPPPASVAADTGAVGGASQPVTDTGASVTLQRWSPNAGYIERLNRAAPEKRHAIYLEERVDCARQPGFFLDVAEFFFAQKDEAEALRVLSNLAELSLEDVALLRVLGHRLVQAGHPELALPVFEKVLVLRGEEPQSRRDLALVCAEVGQYQRAVDLLWEVVAQPWHNRFPDIELIALSELNAIAASCGKELDLSKVDARLRRNLPVGLRTVLTWDADNCDIDLWVEDPNGEQAMYNHPLTYQGGRMSRDFTGGYGPEEFILRDPKSGTYRVNINYFGDSRQTALGPVTVQVRVITDFGTPKQKEQRLTLRLTDKKETSLVGTVEIGGKR